MTAEPALVRKHKVENVRRHSFYAGNESVRPAVLVKYDGARRETREDTPPLNREYTTYETEVESRAKVAQETAD